MTTTIDGTNITFVDGSAFNGANTASQLVPDTNSSETATTYNIGYLAFANTVFSAGGGFIASGAWAFGLNKSLGAFSLSASSGTMYPYVNSTQAANAYTGSQNFYMFNAQGTGPCAGTWKYRGQALNTGLYQYYGNFLLLERVA